MPKPTRRSVLQSGVALAIPLGMVALITGCKQSSSDETQEAEPVAKMNAKTPDSNPLVEEASMKIRYLEIVTPEVEAMCRQYSKIYGITFSEPDGNLGGARTANLDDGGLMGIRRPLRDTEAPVVRPYVLVDDIQAAVKVATESGAEIAMPATQIPERGMFAIVVLGGIDCGFWQD